MKLSISVPDELWEAVAEEGDSASQLVQEALRLLESHRRQDFPTIGDSAYADAALSLDTLEQAVERLTAQAAELRGKGYSIGVDLASALPWTTLDLIPKGPALTRSLREWIELEDDVLSAAVTDALSGLLNDWQEGLDDEGDVIWLPTLYDGIVAGIDETRDAVRRRVRATFVATTKEGS